jgi:RNA polymerase-binding transcription factor
MPTALKTRKAPFRKLLLQKRDELLAAPKVGEALATSVQSPDAVEFAVRSLEQDVTAVTADLRSRTLKEIDSALKRVAGGTYGECEDCGEAINPNRLKAIPWARYCVPCQELRSRN